MAGKRRPRAHGDVVGYAVSSCSPKRGVGLRSCSPLARRGLLLSACAALLLMFVPSGAPAAVFRHDRITYRDASTYRPAVAKAARLWNLAGTDIRLVPTKSRKADILVATRRKLFKPGVHREVLGLGGNAGGVRGTVLLSAHGLGDGRHLTLEQVQTAAHEFGHALGLGHSKNNCDVMFTRADSRPSSGCPAPDWYYQCGPQLADVRILARLYRSAYKPRRGFGRCAYPRKLGEITDPGVLSYNAVDGPALRLAARNTGRTAWTGVILSFVDAEGKRSAGPCGTDPEGYIRDGSLSDVSVPPGGTAMFGFRPCGEPGQTRSFDVRVFDAMIEEGRYMPVTPVTSVTVSFSTPERSPY
jgi:hypothetical protein